MADFDFGSAAWLKDFERSLQAVGASSGLVDTTPIVKPPSSIVYPPFVPPDQNYDPNAPDVYDGPIGTPNQSIGEDVSGNPTVYVPGAGFVPATINEYGSATPITQSSSSASTDSGFSPAADARNTINAVLESYGLGSLSSYLYDTYARQEVNLNNPDALIYALRDQPAYQQRFAGNAARRKKGLAELSPASYVGLEDAYRQLLQANGLPPGFFDQNDDFQKFIENDTSPRELQDRIQLGFKEVDNANPEVLRQIQLLYPESGITGSRESLAAFFLDPVKAAPLLARQAQAAKIGASAYQTGGLQLSAATAENLASYNYSDAQVQSAFGDLNQQAGLLNEMTGEQKLTQEEKLGAVFGTDIGAQKKINQRRDTRKSLFSGGGRGTATSGRTAGVTESGYGTAQ